MQHHFVSSFLNYSSLCLCTSLTTLSQHDNYTEPCTQNASLVTFLCWIWHLLQVYWSFLFPWKRFLVTAQFSWLKIWSLLKSSSLCTVILHDFKNSCSLPGNHLLVRFARLFNTSAHKNSRTSYQAECPNPEKITQSARLWLFAGLPEKFECLVGSIAHCCGERIPGACKSLTLNNAPAWWSAVTLFWQDQAGFVPHEGVSLPGAIFTMPSPVKTSGHRNNEDRPPMLRAHGLLS